MSISDIIRVVMTALHDVSKHDDLRLDPKANASDTRAQRDATNTTSIHPVTDATTSKAFTQTAGGRVLVNDGSNDRVIIGALPDNSFGMKISQPGFDVETASDSQLILNTGQNAFKIVASGTASIAAFTTTDGTENSGTVTITHNLGYVPAFFAFKQGTSGQYLGDWNGSRMLAYSFAAGHALIINGIEFQTTVITSTTIAFTDKVTLSQNGGSFTTPAYNIKYYLLQETAA